MTVLFVFLEKRPSLGERLGKIAYFSSFLCTLSLKHDRANLTFSHHDQACILLRRKLCRFPKCNVLGYLQDILSAGKLGILAINQDIVTCFVVYVQRCIATCFSFASNRIILVSQKIQLISISMDSQRRCDLV